MKVSTVLSLMLAASPAAAIFEDAPTSEELRAEYPELETERPGNPYILCPFLRLLERSGRLDEANKDGDDTIPNSELAAAASDFGCSRTTACGPVITAVSAGQYGWGSIFNPFRTNEVDLERLWDAPPVSHQCGFTFEKDQGQRGVSETRLASTMAKLAARADENGHLLYEDMMDTKNNICDEEGVEPTSAGLLEAELIFAYLGGIERGYIEYSDVERFLAVDNKLPLTKAEEYISALYLQQLP